VPVYADRTTKDVVKIVRAGIDEAKRARDRVVLLDTAGRLQIDEDMMRELVRVKEAVHPDEILLVADGMTGQDAVRIADGFNKALGITGVILTKMDGDARGGAALSIRAVTGQPVKFIGTGEKFDALEPFHPDRLVSRIMGMGDVLSLIERAEEVIDQKQAAEIQKKVLSNTFTLEDFRDQLRQVRKMGSLDQILGMLPNIGPFRDMSKVQVDEKQLNRTEAIISSMTPKERRNHQVINGSRRKRIARGSGTSVQEVNQLLRQYIQARKMMKSMTAGMAGKALGGTKGKKGPKGRKGAKGKKGRGPRGFGGFRVPR
jgi:signal recognition particle subunit SRP54